jgi:phosphatidylglycerophosphate synthase
MLRRRRQAASAGEYETSAESRRRVGERLVVLANAVSLSRLVLSIALIPVYELASSSANSAVLTMVCLIWVSDIVDGRLARAGHRRGAQPRRDGQVIDPLVDDFAYAAGFLILLSAAMVPLWFVSLVILSRCLFGIVRMVGLNHGRPFSSPRLITKVKGVAFAGGQVALFAAMALPQSPLAETPTADVLIGVMTAVCLVAIAQFVVRVNWAVLRDLLRVEP